MGSYAVFSDESHISAHRYRSISSISLPILCAFNLSCEIQSELDDLHLREFRWKKLIDSRYRSAALKITEVLMKWVPHGLRVDTIVWDTYDSRHQIVGRDDAANLGRMYFHLLGFVMKGRETGSLWYVFPDEQTGVDWEKVKECLGCVGRWVKVWEDPLLGASELGELFEIRTFREVHSHKAPVCQAADLFAGLSVYSINKYDKYDYWRKKDMKQMGFFPEDKTITLSKSDRARLPVLHHFVSSCKAKSLGVSIDHKKRLWTPNPTNPINFWHYTPQHEYDKAPTRGEYW